MKDLMLGTLMFFIVVSVIYVLSWKDMKAKLKEEIENNKILIQEKDKELENRANVILEKIKIINQQKAEIEELVTKAEVLAALRPVSDILTSNEIDEILEEFDPSSPFDSATRVTSRFGEGRGYQGELRNGHLGNDLVPSGDWYVHPMWEGEVTDIGIDRWLGKYILIQHTPLIRTRYAHLNTIFYTALPGEHVTNETKIGIMGQTGHADGAHLHWAVEIFNGEKWVPIDGYPWLKGHGNN